MVSLVASAAARSRAKSPVATDWFVTRKVSTSETDCCCALAAHVGPNRARVTQAQAIRLVTLRPLQVDVRRGDRIADYRSRDGRAVAVREIGALPVLVVRVAVGDNPPAARH